MSERGRDLYGISPLESLRQASRAFDSLSYDDAMLDALRYALVANENRSATEAQMPESMETNLEQIRQTPTVQRMVRSIGHEIAFEVGQRDPGHSFDPARIEIHIHEDIAENRFLITGTYRYGQSEVASRRFVDRDVLLREERERAAPTGWQVASERAEAGSVRLDINTLRQARDLLNRNSYQESYEELLARWFRGATVSSTPMTPSDWQRLSDPDYLNTIRQRDEGVDMEMSTAIGPFLSDRSSVVARFGPTPSRILEVNKFLDYLSYLQTQQGVNLGEATIADFPDFFIQMDNGIATLPLIKPKINQNVESFLERVKITRESARDDFDLPPLIKERIGRAFKLRVDRQLSSLREDEGNCLRQISDRQAQISLDWSRIAQLRVVINALESQPPSDAMVGKIKEIVRDSFWSFKDFRDSCLILETAQPITLVYTNPAAGINFNVTFGKFVARLNVETLSLKVGPSDRRANLESNGYFHPHIRDENMCYGNAADTMTRAIQNLDLAVIFNVVKSILVTYNPDSPWRELVHFQDAQTRRRNAPPPPQQAAGAVRNTAVSAEEPDFDPDIEAPEEEVEEAEEEDGDEEYYDDNGDDEP